MSREWDVEVLTSRACEYIERFENDYPEGLAVVEGIPVRRFNIDRLRSEAAVFSALDQKVLQRRSSVAEDREWLREIGPDCGELHDYIRIHAPEFDVIVFYTYLYATTTLTLPMVREKAVLVPTAHDEPPIHTRPFDTFFQLPRLLLCSTPEEESFLRLRTAGAMAPSMVAGIGVDIPADVDAQLFRQRYSVPGKYFLYVGRIQKEKGADTLFDYYLSLPPGVRETYPLVLLGKAAMEIPGSPDIRHVGFVSEEEKYSAMAGATLLVAPSQFESLSMVLLEAWAVGTPVIVNGQCDVLVRQVVRANGGLWYDNREEFWAAIGLLTHPAQKLVAGSLGQNGKRFVQTFYGWDTMADRFRNAIRVVKDNGSAIERDERAVLPAPVKS
jgi:glycosyltransferase involved in cell wall biosynthesis